MLRLAGGETSLDDATLPVTLRGELSLLFRRRNGFTVDGTFMAERLRRVYAHKSWGHCLRAFVGGHANRTSALRSPRDAFRTAGLCFWTRLTCEEPRSVVKRCSNFKLEHSPRRKKTEEVHGGSTASGGTTPNFTSEQKWTNSHYRNFPPLVPLTQTCGVLLRRLILAS